MDLTPIVAGIDGFRHMNGFGWWGMMGFGWIMGLLIIGLLVWVVVQSTQRSGNEPAPSAIRTAVSILTDRFARGGIDEDEYLRRRAALRT